MEATTLESSCSADDFLRAAAVWLERPQVLNKRLFGAVLSRGSVREGEPFTRQLLPRGRQPATEELVEIGAQSAVGPRVSCVCPVCVQTV